MLNLDADDEQGDGYEIRVTRKDGTVFVAELGTGYDDRVQLSLYGNGVVVMHPDKPPVYVNGNTSQVSRNPEVCRSALILAPTAEDIGRLRKKGLH